MDHLIHHAKTVGNSIVIVLLDLVKVNDTVSHKHILTGLKCLGVRTFHWIGGRAVCGTQTYLKL